MERLEGGTNIGVGLRLAASMIPRRNLNVSRVLILVSDGEPEGCGETPDDAIAVADEIRQEGIFILPIGVGDGIRRSLLEELASNKSHVYTVADYEGLKQALGTIVEGTCAAVAKPCTTAKVGLSPLIAETFCNFETQSATPSADLYTGDQLGLVAC
jgi:hypothetical protein